MNIALCLGIVSGAVVFGAWASQRSIRGQLGARRAGQHSPK